MGGEAKIELVEKTNEELKTILQLKYPKVREDVFNDLTIKQNPMTSSDHMKIFIRLTQEETNNPRLQELNQIAAAAHAQIMKELNVM